MSAIKRRLIENCRICWERYGYKKTGVSELAAMTGISPASLYTFFSSKEVLFAETANDFYNGLYELIRTRKPMKPTKSDLAESFKLAVGEIRKNKWIFNLRDDYEVFMRKLPPGYLEQDYQRDLIDISRIIDIYGVKPKASLSEITAVIYSIVLSLYFTDVIGEQHQNAVDFLIDSAVGKLFQ
ncbi:MAG: TetR/AcrR family transcriptional regulator [Clostridiales Family XIII bacterium]|nr:TetR/AcrR family transcriptional regulator [Clostridiales Family XIII bacterium]